MNLMIVDLGPVNHGNTLIFVQGYVGKQKICEWIKKNGATKKVVGATIEKDQLVLLHLKFLFSSGLQQNVMQY